MELVILFSASYVSVLLIYTVFVYRGVKKKKKITDFEYPLGAAFGFGSISYVANNIEFSRENVALLSFVYALVFAVYCVGLMVIKHKNKIN